ncbi:unnamed protein product [Penicillium salamii]|nr:unnamed protein product [Penicillium salamii]
MAFRLFTPSSSILRLGLGVGIGLSAATMHPLSPFRAAPMLCDYASPLPQQSTFKKEPEWAVAGKPAGKSSRTGLLNAESMRQVSLGSVLGLVAGVGLRAFSKALVVLLGMGVVFVEVCQDLCGHLTRTWLQVGVFHVQCADCQSTLRPRDTTSFRCIGCKNMSRTLTCTVL